MICDRCHREVHKSPVFVGGKTFGPVCAKAAQPPEADATQELFFDLEHAELMAKDRVYQFIDWVALVARVEVARDFAQARERLGL